jgi:hypothetical protein
MYDAARSAGCFRGLGDPAGKLVHVSYKSDIVGLCDDADTVPQACHASPWHGVPAGTLCGIFQHHASNVLCHLAGPVNS